MRCWIWYLAFTVGAVVAWYRGDMDVAWNLLIMSQIWLATSYVVLGEQKR